MSTLTIKASKLLKVEYMTRDARWRQARCESEPSMGAE